MIYRIWYALSMIRQHCKTLKAYNQDPSLQVNSVLQLVPTVLKAQGIRAIVVDFDGVLAPHGENCPNSNLEDWLNSCVHSFGLGRVFILSNKPTLRRQAYFTEHFTGIEFVIGKKKPYPDGILKIAKITDLIPAELLVVDDRLLTGVLAAIIAGASARYVVNPLANFTKRPLVESFFAALRKIERWLIVCC